MLFEAEFHREIQRQLAEKQANAGKTLVEQLGTQKSRPAPLKPTRFKVEGDDENQTLMWRELMKDCAFYFDVPTLEEERDMRSLLQRKYDGILKPGWRPALTSRRDLLPWACRQYNQVQEEKGKLDDLGECDNYAGLLAEFGPDYDRLRPKLGHIRGLFE